MLTVGAAMTIDKLPQYRDWLIESQRDLEIQDPYRYDLLDGDWKAKVAEAKSLLDGYEGRMGVHGPFIGLSIAAPDPKVRRVMAERHMQGLEFAAELGATHMVVHSPIQLLGLPEIKDQPYLGFGDWIEVVHQTLEDVVKQAEQIGCTLVIENIFDRSPRLLLELVRSFNSDSVRMSLDTGHAHVNHMIGAPPVSYWVSEAGHMLEHIHIQDTDGYADRHWTLGKGSINWYAVFNAINALEHTPRLILELMNTDEIPQSLQWLNEQGLAQ